MITSVLDNDGYNIRFGFYSIYQSRISFQPLASSFYKAF